MHLDLSLSPKVLVRLVPLRLVPTEIDEQRREDVLPLFVFTYSRVTPLPEKLQVLEFFQENNFQVVSRYAIKFPDPFPPDRLSFFLATSAELSSLLFFALLHSANNRRQSIFALFLQFSFPASATTKLPRKLDQRNRVPPSTFL